MSSPASPSFCAEALSVSGVAEGEPKVSLESILDNPHLPTPPALALQIIDRTSRPDCDPKDILRLLSQDPGLCGKLLQAVNSSLFGLSRPVASLDRAVRVVGLKPLRSLVLGWSLSAIHVHDQDNVIWRFWQESLAGAVMAHDLAVQLRRPDRDEYLVAGLLRDVGILVLRQVFPDEYKTLAAAVSRTGADFCKAEEAAFGLDHCEVSAGLLDSWNLPADLVQPIRYHHYPERLENAPKALADRAWLLSFTSELARLNDSAPGQIGEVVRVAKARFDMDYGALAKFLGSVTPRIKEFAAVLKMEIGKCPDFAAIVATGCKELVSLSSQSNATARVARSGLKTDDAPVRFGDTTPHAPSKRSSVPAPTKTAARTPSAGHAPGDFDFTCLRQLPAGGARLGGYDVKEKIGAGAMGIVFKAFDPLLQRYAAIKFLTPERVVVSEARERFLREARAAAAIQHENVITIYAVGEVSCLPYVVMEYLPGMSLQDRLDQGTPLPMGEVIVYARQIAAGLHAAHARGVIHRDVKPANILIAKDSNVAKITDFGLARIRDASALSQDGHLIGTPLYMSPEQFGGETLDHRADLFAFGSVLYTLCTGQPPFDGDSMMVLMRQICEQPMPPVRKLRPDCPAWLENLILKLHAKEPAERPTAAGEIVHAIDQNARR